jgi:hypothetical protein
MLRGSFASDRSGPVFRVSAGALASGFALLAGALLATVGAAQAQFAAPGSVSPDAPSLAAPPADAGLPTLRRRRAAPAASAADTITQRTLLQNGALGRLELERRDGALAATRLQLSGLASDGSGKVCRVDLAAAGPVVARDLGKDTGLNRYELPVQGCDMTFSALNAAVLMKGPGQACVFAREACRVDVSGMWGPPAASVVKSARDIEKARGRAEQQVRSHYKTLIGRAGGHDAVKVVAREQAGFTSEREMACGGYENETAHGFCHARYTEARAAELAARLGVSNRAQADEPRAERRKRRHDKPAAAPAAPGTTTPSLF